MAERIDQPRIDVQTDAFDNPRAFRRRHTRAHGLDQPIANHHRSALDGRSGGRVHRHVTNRHQAGRVYT